MTGHIWAVEPPGVRHRVRRLLGHAVATHRLTVVSALAAGADRLVAGEALAAGARLEAVLPFAAAVYEQDDPGSVEEFRSLLGRCAAVEVLPGDPVAASTRDAAYAAAGRAVLARSHVLIAVWDGEPARGTGGTGEIVAAAASAGTPVAWIGMDGALRLLAPEDRRRDVSESLGLSEAG